MGKILEIHVMNKELIFMIYREYLHNTEKEKEDLIVVMNT